MKKDRVKLVSTVELNAYSPWLMRNSPSESTGTRHPVLTSSGSPVNGSRLSRRLSCHDAVEVATTSTEERAERCPFFGRATNCRASANPNGAGNAGTSKDGGLCRHGCRDGGADLPRQWRPAATTTTPAVSATTGTRLIDNLSRPTSYRRLSRGKGGNCGRGGKRGTSKDDMA